MRSGNRKHLLLNLAAIGLALILIVMLGWRTLLAEERDSYRQYLSLIRSLPLGASELEVWCIAEGETWDASTSTCFVDERATVPSYGTLTVLSGETIKNNGSIIDNEGAVINNYGTIFNNPGIFISAGIVINNNSTINNYGTIYNDEGAIIINNGTIDNRGKIRNYSIINSSGSIDNYGIIVIHEGFTINNYGSINNYDTIKNDDGTINNEGIINNYGHFNNGGTINNDNGTINNHCSGIYNGNPPIGSPIVDTC